MQETDAAGSLESKKLESIRLGIIGTGRITKRFVPNP